MMSKYNITAMREINTKRIMVRKLSEKENIVKSKN